MSMKLVPGIGLGFERIPTSAVDEALIELEQFVAECLGWNPFGQISRAHLSIRTRLTDIIGVLEAPTLTKQGDVLYGSIDSRAHPREYNRINRPLSDGRTTTCD